MRTGFGPAYVYSDGWVDDARLVILNARDAADHGADIRPRTQVLLLEQAGDHWRIHARDAAGQAQTFHARVVVNATGPAVLDLLDRGAPPPAAIIGLPVGFVGTRESKAALRGCLSVPRITNSGYRGGSPWASSVVNSCLIAAQNRLAAVTAPQLPSEVGAER